MKSIKLDLAIKNDFAILKEVEGKSIVIDEFFLDALLLQCKKIDEVLNGKMFVVYAPGIWKKIQGEEPKDGLKLVGFSKYIKFKGLGLTLKKEKMFLMYNDLNKILEDIPESEIIKIVKING